MVERRRLSKKQVEKAQKEEKKVTLPEEITHLLETMGKPGRQSLYDPKYVKIAEALCAHGATDAELASAFEVASSTVQRWYSEYPEFGAAVKKAKIEVFDARVERSMAERAVGYAVDTIEYKVVDKMLIPVPVRKHYPPDVTACIFWLKNRQPKKWRDVYDHNHSSADKTLTAEQLLEEIKNDIAKLNITPAQLEALTQANGLAGKLKH